MRPWSERRIVIDPRASLPAPEPEPAPDTPATWFDVALYFTGAITGAAGVLAFLVFTGRL